MRNPPARARHLELVSNDSAAPAGEEAERALRLLGLVEGEIDAFTRIFPCLSEEARRFCVLIMRSEFNAEAKKRQERIPAVLPVRLAEVRSPEASATKSRKPSAKNVTGVDIHRTRSMQGDGQGCEFSSQPLASTGRRP